MKSSLHLLCAVLLALIAVSSSFQVVLQQNDARHRVISLAMSEEPSAAEEAAPEEPPKPKVACPDCDLCDGSGRIAGGIGAVLPWIPIKAYRPCPNFIERGGSYQRAGQGLDEIAFGKKGD